MFNWGILMGYKHYKVYNYIKISDVSKLLVVVTLISFYAFPFLTISTNIMGQEFSYELSNTGVSQSTKGLFTGENSLSQKIPYITYMETYKKSNENSIPKIDKIIIYIYTHVPSFSNIWLLLSILLIVSMFIKERKYVGIPAAITVFYYIYLMYTIYEAVQYLGYYPNISDLITGIPIVNNDSFLGIKTSETFILKLGYGWYISLLSNFVLLHENL